MRIRLKDDTIAHLHLRNWICCAAYTTSAHLTTTLMNSQVQMRDRFVFETSSVR